MAFSKYKEMGQVQLEFGITLQNQAVIPAERVEPTTKLVQELEFNVQMIPIFSDRARAEALIFPVLREVYKDYLQTYNLWIDVPLSYNAKLSGTLAYLLAARSPLGITVFTKPLVPIILATKNDFEYGWGQCLAALVATQKINGAPLFPSYGIVTDGERWQFGKLEKDRFTHNFQSHPLDDLPSLFGALHFVFRTIQTALATSPLRP